jgi:serine/threonine protein kinase
MMVVHEWLPQCSLQGDWPDGNGWKKVSATDKLRFIVGIVLGLRYLHRLGIAQAGFSPDSIWVTDDFGAKLEGLQYWLHLPDELANPSWLFYCPPECADAETPYHPPGDVFTLGILMWEIVTGRPLRTAFGSSISVLAFLNRIVKGDRPSLRGVPDGSGTLIEACWQSNPECRPTADKVLKALKDLRYQLIPDVDSEEIEVYVQSILATERALEQPGSA